MKNANQVGEHKTYASGCLIAVAVMSILAVVGAIVLSIYWNKYWYEDDNACRREPMDNLNHFHTEMKGYLSAHEGRFPTGQGAAGLGELVPYLPYLRLKDDKEVEISPDIFTENHSSYAYVASGLNENELDCVIPVIFEKPWNRKLIRVLLSDGRVDVLEGKGFLNCCQVIGHYKDLSGNNSPFWETLLRNAEYIDHKRMFF